MMPFQWVDHCHCEFMHDPCTAEIYRPGAIFSVVTHNELWKKRYSINWCVTAVRVIHSRSSKLVRLQKFHMRISIGM